MLLAYVKMGYAVYNGRIERPCVTTFCTLYIYRSFYSIISDILTIAH